MRIHLAAGYLSAGHSIARFLEKFRESDLALPASAPDDHARGRRYILKHSFALSLAALEAEGVSVAAYRALGHAPLSGFGTSLGAAIAGLEEGPFEDLCVVARGLSLVERLPEPGRWRLHPLLAEWARAAIPETEPLDRMTDWFVARLPLSENERWHELNAEYLALTDWLQRAPAARHHEINRAGSRFAWSNGPFHAWYQFCEALLDRSERAEELSNVLWTLGQVAFRLGRMTKALSLA